MLSLIANCNLCGIRLDYCFLPDLNFETIPWTLGEPGGRFVKPRTTFNLYCCSYKLGLLLLGVVTARALLFEVCIKTFEFSISLGSRYGTGFRKSFPCRIFLSQVKFIRKTKEDIDTTMVSPGGLFVLLVI